MIVAERRLSLAGHPEHPEHPEHPVVAVRLHAPVRKSPAEWTCAYEIDWPEGLRTMRAHGFDAVQALVIAMQMIAAELYVSAYHEAGQLAFGSPGSGYGFPLPANVRDLAVGEDARFFEAEP